MYGETVLEKRVSDAERDARAMMQNLAYAASAEAAENTPDIIRKATKDEETKWSAKFKLAKDYAENIEFGHPSQDGLVTLIYLATPDGKVLVHAQSAKQDYLFSLQTASAPTIVSLPLAQVARCFPIPAEMNAPGALDLAPL